MIEAIFIDTSNIVVSPQMQGYFALLNEQNRLLGEIASQLDRLNAIEEDRDARKALRLKYMGPG